MSYLIESGIELPARKSTKLRDTVTLCFVAGLALYLCFSSHIARELREVQDTY